MGGTEQPKRSKRAKPSFDIARTDLQGQRAGWVYRSDAPAQADAPVPALVVEPDPPVVEKSVAPPASAVFALPVAPTAPAALSPAPRIPEPAATPVVSTSPPPRAHREDEAEAVDPSSSSSKTRTSGWVRLSVGVMVLPLTLPILAMIAPVVWLAGSRPRR